MWDFGKVQRLLEEVLDKMKKTSLLPKSVISESEGDFREIQFSKGRGNIIYRHNPALLCLEDTGGLGSSVPDLMHLSFLRSTTCYVI